MKAPKLFLALSLAIPVLVHGLDPENRHGHEGHAHSAVEHLKNHPHEHEAATKPAKHDHFDGVTKPHHNTKFYDEGPDPVNLKRDPNHADHQQGTPPSPDTFLHTEHKKPKHKQPKHKKPPAAVDERSLLQDATEDDVEGLPNPRCNPASPFGPPTKPSQQSSGDTLDANSQGIRAKRSELPPAAQTDQVMRKLLGKLHDNDGDLRSKRDHIPLVDESEEFFDSVEDEAEGLFDSDDTERFLEHKVEELLDQLRGQLSNSDIDDDDLLKRNDLPDEEEFEEKVNELAEIFGDIPENSELRLLQRLCQAGMDRACEELLEHGLTERDVDDTDDNPHRPDRRRCKWARMECLLTGYKNVCDIYKHCPRSMAKRDLASTPIVDQPITISLVGQDGIGVVSVSPENPNVGVVKIDAEDKEGTVAMSVVTTGTPRVIFDGTIEGQAVKMTIPVQTVPVKRNVLATPTPGFVTTEHYSVNGQPASAVFSVVATSPALVLVENYYDGPHARTHTQSFLPGMTPPILGKRDVWDDLDSTTLVSESLVDASTTALTEGVIDASTTVLTEGFVESSASISVEGSLPTSSGFATEGLSGTLLIEATDENGMPIYATRTGDYAISTKTLTFNPTSNPVVTQSGTVTEYRIIRETVTVGPGYHRGHTHARGGPTQMIFDMGSTTVTMTNSAQTLNSGNVAFVASNVEATLMPFGWNARYANGRNAAPYAAITTLNPSNVRRYFGGPTVIPFLDSIVTMNGSIHAVGGSHMTANGTVHIVPTKVAAVDPVGMYAMYDPRYHRVAPTPACVPGRHRDDAECSMQQCMWNFMRPMALTTAFPAVMYSTNGDQMTDYFTHRTTIDDVHWGTREHGGIIGAALRNRVYYPVKQTTTHLAPDKYHNTTRPTCAFVRDKPPNSARSHLLAAGDPHCYDEESCYEWCRHDVRHSGSRLLSTPLLTPIVALPLLLPVLACCVLPWLIRRRRRARKNSDPFERISRGAAGNQPRAVVNSVTGQATDPATGRAVDPASTGPGTTGVVAGAAAGAAAARAEHAASGGGGSGGGASGQGGSGAGASGGGQGGGSGSGAHGDGHGGGNAAAADDGKGTMGRRAEEGRARIRFDAGDGGKPQAVSDGEPHTRVVGSGGDSHAKDAAAAKPHVEAVPKTDGAADGTPTGRQMIDTGSMRGRKRSRVDGQGGLKLGF